MEALAIREWHDDCLSSEHEEGPPDSTPPLDRVAALDRRHLLEESAMKKPRFATSVRPETLRSLASAELALVLGGQGSVQPAPTRPVPLPPIL